MNCVPRRIGNSYVICDAKVAPSTHFQLMVGPDWTCMCMTYVLILVPSILFLINIAPTWGAPVIAVSIFFLILTICLFSATACRDPGIVFDNSDGSDNSITEDEERGGRNSAESDGENDDSATHNDIRVGASRRTGLATPAVNPRVSLNNRFVPRELVECGVCNIRRPPNASHCYECGVCVVELDHHCPWTGKCIGQRTLRSFYGFLLSLSVWVFIVVVFVIMSVLRGQDIFNFTH
mmetsp:Transcript_29034/g.41430  ORF Transcript_29034/g.41430 Transcript_29034/m.41430 type:complete len:236 (+) Transcript_29034:44-751(+)